MVEQMLRLSLILFLYSKYLFLQPVNVGVRKTTSSLHGFELPARQAREVAKYTERAAPSLHHTGQMYSQCHAPIE